MTTNRWNPDLYADRAAFVTTAGRDLVELLAPRAGERVLDIGCGRGELTADIAARGATVVGLDASEDMLVAARAAHPALSFVAADAQDLRDVDEYEAAFSAVFSNAALHWMPRIDDVVAGVARALSRPGRFVAELGGRGNTDTVLRALRAVLPRLGLETERYIPWTFPSPAHYATILERHGFRVRFMTHFDRPSRMDGEHGLRAWLTIFSEPLLVALGDRRELFFTEMEPRAPMPSAASTPTDRAGSSITSASASSPPSASAAAPAAPTSAHRRPNSRGEGVEGLVALRCGLQALCSKQRFAPRPSGPSTVTT